MVRVDDRLVHGQVTQGWGSVLDPDRFVVINDAAAADSWERELYESSAPDGTAITVVALDEARARLEKWLEEGEELILLLEHPADALRLFETGFHFTELNLGGLHQQAGRNRVLPYICLGQDDITALESLRARGVTVECADVPGCERKDLFACLGNAANGT
jgi:mannose/fructose/N-acetylgalactosamine-specific phosphotransferase system component IIB